MSCTYTFVCRKCHKTVQEAYFMPQMCTPCMRKEGLKTPFEATDYKYDRGDYVEFRIWDVPVKKLGLIVDRYREYSKGNFGYVVETYLRRKYHVKEDEIIGIWEATKQMSKSGAPDGYEALKPTKKVTKKAQVRPTPCYLCIHFVVCKNITGWEAKAGEEIQVHTQNKKEPCPYYMERIDWEEI